MKLNGIVLFLSQLGAAYGKTPNLRGRLLQSLCNGSKVQVSDKVIGKLCYSKLSASASFLGNSIGINVSTILSVNNNGITTWQQCQSLGGSWKKFTCNDANSIVSDNIGISAVIELLNENCCETPSTSSPTQAVTLSPTTQVTNIPTTLPSAKTTTRNPTKSPTDSPTISPTVKTTTQNPTEFPTESLTISPTAKPQTMRSLCKGSKVQVSDKVIGKLCYSKSSASASFLGNTIGINVSTILSASNNGITTWQQCQSLKGSYKQFTCNDANSIVSDNIGISAVIELLKENIELLKENCCETPSTSSATQDVTLSPTTQVTNIPTSSPSAKNTTRNPTKSPTDSPTISPTAETTTQNPTEFPTKAPTEAPTPQPTKAPTEAPTPPPTKVPTEAPTPPPTKSSTEAPTTRAPTDAPTTAAPTKSPVQAPGICTPIHKELKDKCAAMENFWKSVGGEQWSKKGVYERLWRATCCV